MTNRERVQAILNYRDYDRLPLVHFGYWKETLSKWAGCLGEVRGGVDGRRLQIPLPRV